MINLYLYLRCYGAFMNKNFSAERQLDEKKYNPHLLDDDDHYLICILRLLERRLQDLQGPVGAFKSVEDEPEMSVPLLHYNPLLVQFYTYFFIGH